MAPWFDRPWPKEVESRDREEDSAPAPPKDAPSASDRVRSSGDANREAESARDLFGSPPLLERENISTYDELVTRISAVVKPADFLEEIWLRDVVDHTWAVHRLRRLTVSLIAATEHKGLREILVPLVGSSRAETLADAWAASRSSDVVEEIDKSLASAGLSMDAVMAQTWSLKLSEIERFDAMMALAEARRNASLREIDRHREILGERLRRAVQQLEEGQLRVIGSNSINGTKE